MRESAVLMRPIVRCLSVLLLGLLSVSVWAQAESPLVETTVSFLTLYTSGAYFEALDKYTTDDFRTQAYKYRTQPYYDYFCSDVMPTRLHVETIDEYRNMVRVTTNTVDFIVTLKWINEVLYVDSLHCATSPDGIALDYIVEDELRACVQDSIFELTVGGTWLNRAGDQALVRLQTDFAVNSVYVHLALVDDVWIAQDRTCGHYPEGAALNWATAYLALWRGVDEQGFVLPALYNMGSDEMPVFAYLVSTEGGFELKAATVVVQFELLEQDPTDDTTCRVKMKQREYSGWIIEQVFCRVE